MTNHLNVSRIVLAAVLILSLGMSGAETAHASHGNKGFTGSWTVVGQPDGPAPGFINVSTHHSDGTLTNTDPIFGTGHGVWQKTGPRTFTAHFVTIVSPFSPLLANSVISVTGHIKLDKSGNAGSGVFETVFTDLDGNEILAPSTGTIDFARIGLY